MAANGYLSLSSLMQVDGWAYLEANTAHAWVAFCNEMVSLGFARPTITAPDGAYRDFARQVYWKNYWTAQGKPGNASTPGYSNHGLGTCVDVWNVYQYPFATVLSVMAKHGFVHDFAPEQWHFHHTSINPADLGSTPFPAAATVASAAALPPKKFYRKRRDEMTDSILWYVPKASTDGTIKAGTAWFQRTPGAAIVQLDGNGVVGQSSEYTALLNLNYRMNDGTPGANDNPEALRNFYTQINGDDLLRLISLRGLVPVYDAVGAVSNGEPITDGAAILAAIKAIPAPPTKATVTLS